MKLFKVTFVKYWSTNPTKIECWVKAKTKTHACAYVHRNSCAISCVRANLIK